MAKFHQGPYVKYGFNCADFHGICNCSIELHIGQLMCESVGKISFTRVTEIILTKLALAGQIFLYISILNFSKIQQMFSAIVTDRHTTDGGTWSAYTAFLFTQQRMTNRTKNSIEYNL